MFRRKNNIVKQAGKKLSPDRKQLEALIKKIWSNAVKDAINQQQNLDYDSDPKVDKPKKKRNESYYRDKLARSLNGQTEVVVPAGRIDILTSNQVIEVKHIKKWNAALGQVITYGVYYPNHQKRIHLFGVENNSSKIILIKEQCRMQNIIATFEE